MSRNNNKPFLHLECPFISQAAHYGCGCWAENACNTNPYSTAVSTSGTPQHTSQSPLCSYNFSSCRSCSQPACPFRSRWIRNRNLILSRLTFYRIRVELQKAWQYFPMTVNNSCRVVLLVPSTVSVVILHSLLINSMLDAPESSASDVMRHLL